MGLRRLSLVLACAATAVSLSGCFLEPDVEEDEPLREGLNVKVGGIEYNVFITRELNPALPDDRGYWQGEEAKPGFALYGVFLQACNRSDEDDDLEDDTYEATEDFVVIDTQGNEYEPLEVDEENVFQYHAGPRRAGPVHTRGRKPRPAGPDGRRDAPVPLPARGGREPPARARDPGRGRRGSRRAGPLGPAHRHLLRRRPGWPVLSVTVRRTV